MAKKRINVWSFTTVKLQAKILWILAIVFTMTAAACGKGGGNNTAEKTIIITGLPNGVGNLISRVIVYDENNDVVAWGSPDDLKSSNSMTFELSIFPIGGAWTGSGQYKIDFETGVSYFYTNGKTWEQLGVTEIIGYGEYVEYAPTYNINSAKTTIPYSKFTQYQPKL